YGCLKTLHAFATALGLAIALGAAQAKPPPPQRAAASQQDVVAPAATSSSEPRNTPADIKAPEAPECQIKLGKDWAPTVRTMSFEACADELDKVAPRADKTFTTAYWKDFYLAADAKTIYRADAKSDWSVFRQRKPR